MTFMEGVIERGYAERVESTQSPSKDAKKFEDSQDVSPSVCSIEWNVWYIPHYGIYHPKKPNKIRVVFDCAAEFIGESSNKHLLEGPDITHFLWCPQQISSGACGDNV